MAQKIKKILLAASVLFFLFMPMALADPGGCASGYVKSGNSCVPEGGITGNNAKLTYGNGCANVPQNTVGEQQCLSNDPLIKDLKIIINALSGLVGIVVIAMIIVGGIEYALARNNPNKIGAAQKRIINSIVALIIYALIFAFVEWIIPGGIFS